MFCWQPSDSSYVELGTSSHLDIGQGYWLVTAGSGTLTSVGLPAPENGLYLSLLTSGPSGRPGWNQIANPFLFPVPAGLLGVTDGGQTKLLIHPSQTLAEHANHGL